ADVQSTRTELQALGQTLGELRAEVRRSSEEVVGGAGAALVASAAAAMARLEGRMDGEFDNVGRQMEALGTLLGQVIDSVQRVEAEVVGIHPVTEKTRSAAATVLDSLRTSVRQRSARRPPPPELGSGL
ncbi:MAG TPA: hypothetical protein VGZ52_13145, partial [Acidimicrobiales bacterium]|nr:hypothetical protein [Acidimicrobiales bacterium]